MDTTSISNHTWRIIPAATEAAARSDAVPTNTAEDVCSVTASGPSDGDPTAAAVRSPLSPSSLAAVKRGQDIRFSLFPPHHSPCDLIVVNLVWSAMHAETAPWPLMGTHCISMATSRAAHSHIYWVRLICSLL
jgi:hypothetical protein